jgi:hypothetical protein
VIQIQSFANMDLVPGNGSISQRLTEKRLTKDGAGTEARHLLCLHRRADWKQAKSGHASLPFDAAGIGKILAQHLHPAADTHHQANTRVPAHRSIEFLSTHPVQVAHGLFAAG